MEGMCVGFAKVCIRGRRMNDSGLGWASGGSVVLENVPMLSFFRTSCCGIVSMLCAFSFLNAMTKVCVVFAILNKIGPKTSSCACVSLLRVLWRFPSPAAESRVLFPSACVTWVLTEGRTTSQKEKRSTGERLFYFQNDESLCSCPGNRTACEAPSRFYERTDARGAQAVKRVCLSTRLTS